MLRQQLFLGQRQGQDFSLKFIAYKLPRRSRRQSRCFEAIMPEIFSASTSLEAFEAIEAGDRLVRFRFVMNGKLKLVF